MAYPNVGRNTGIGFGKESTWGTAVARTGWSQAVSVAMARKVNRQQVPHLVHGDYGNAAFLFEATEDAGGPVEVLLRYGSLGLLLEALFGKVAEGGGVGPSYTHTYTLYEPQPSLTMEVIRGWSAVTVGVGTAEVFEGCKVRSGRISQQAGDIARLSLDIIAETAAARGAAGTPSYPTAQMVLPNHSGQVTFNSVPYTMRSFELAINHQLARIDELGTLYTAEPAPTTFMEVTLKIQVSYRADSLYTAFLAGTHGDVTFSLTGTSPNVFAFTINNAQIVECTDPISNAGVIVQDVTFRGLYDAGSEGCNLVLTNGNPLHTA